ncbi:universal stress protein [Pricia sp. S334]|uniref:Universal stress protein n=1 Tax=Pricia mediterranea TaxID=3076079 RepID=A0ABU3L114_9FLAO|nr:universal stress protein [Pricia sp. S334]MDT7827419.1 universal stress protein [Pricia sp. S334]
MKKIILPTDFSDNAFNAIRYAVQLYKDIETTFYLLHTYTPPVYQMEYVMQSPAQFGLGDRHRQEAANRLNGLRDKIKSEFGNQKHSFITHVAFNTLIYEILETIENEKADLVIMGTQGATGATEILFGTNTVHLIKKTTCPVIAVPSEFEYENPKEILFPTDYIPDYSQEQLQQLVDIAENHKSHLEIIHVSSGFELADIQESNKKKLKVIFAEISHSFHDLPDQGVIAAINNFQKKKEIKILAMIRNKHTFFERMFIEPVIKKLGFHVNIPFMVIP